MICFKPLLGVLLCYSRLRIWSCCCSSSGHCCDVGFNPWTQELLYAAGAAKQKPKTKTNSLLSLYACSNSRNASWGLLDWRWKGYTREHFFSYKLNNNQMLESQLQPYTINNSEWIIIKKKKPLSVRAEAMDLSEENLGITSQWWIWQWFLRCDKDL